MMNVKTSTANQNQIMRVEAELGKVLDEILKRGFYGNAAVAFNVHDGRIQHVRLTVDRLVK